MEPKELLIDPVEPDYPIRLFGRDADRAWQLGRLCLAGRAGLVVVGRFGIRVNVVAPGLIETSMTEMLPDAVKARAVEETALGTVGRPEDVARAVLYLCSELSSHVTGQVLRVDGGQLTA